MQELFVDNFAGGGGASTGIEMAIGRSVDIAINHDPSEEFGINGGRISKLWMQNNITKETVANYDRGWDIEPDKKNQQVMVAYYLLLKDYN